MEKQKISIQQPCYMKWKYLEKIQNSKNRRCGKCAIDIVDFTHMSNEEIIAYISERKTEKVCAKMYSEKNLSKIQGQVLNWHENVKSNFKNRYFKSIALIFVGLIMFTTGCVEAVGEPAPPCRDELVPDTTTAEPNDSVLVEICE